MNSVPKSNHTNNINAIDMQMALIVTRRALSAYLFFVLAIRVSESESDSESEAVAVAVVQSVAVCLLWTKTETDNRKLAQLV